MNQNRGMSNRFAVWLVAVLFGALGASGLVNLNFTPVDLVKSSKAIVCVEVGPYDESKAILPVKIIRALKGEAPKSLTIDLGDAGDQVMAEIKESIPAGDIKAPVVAVSFIQRQGLGKVSSVFTGDYEADGRLDVVVVAEKGASLLSNAGGGKFVETWEETGELDYHSKNMQTASGGITCDLNNDDARI